jgi:nitrile hydratase accessory protein
MSLREDIRDEATLPRRNGELVFEAPWESRAFGVAVALAEAGTCDWDSFRGRLIEEIGAAEGEPWNFYERWLAALERLLVEERLVSSEELAAAHARAEHDAAHEHDDEHGHHDHDHPHAHHHG